MPDFAVIFIRQDDGTVIEYRIKEPAKIEWDTRVIVDPAEYYGIVRSTSYYHENDLHLVGFRNYRARLHTTIPEEMIDRREH